MKKFMVLVMLVHVSQHVSAVDRYEGDQFVLLPCEFHTFEMDDPTVMWSRYDLSPSTVHQRQQEGDELKDQNQLYSGRTSMKPDALDTGDLSLNLTRLKLSDSGAYICSVRSTRGERVLTVVQLQVKERFPSWAIVLLVLLAVVSLVAGSLLVVFRHYFISVYYVEVDSGVESVQLPCKTTVRLARDATVEWQNNDNDKVHVYQNGYDQLDEQNWFYKGRTHMQRSLLRTGNLSLTLKYPTVRDKGAFTCTVYSAEGNILMKKQVEFRVKVPQVVEVDSGVESVQLPCTTTVHLLEDVKVEWRNSYNWMIHVYQNGLDKPEHQDEEYIGRTELVKNLLKTGDLSLTLTYPTVRDRNTYTCIVYSSEGTILMKEDVQLRVKDCQVEVEEGVESVQLPFRTTANLPGDAKVEWKREEPEPKMTVHLYQKGFDQAGEQNQFYSGRTEIYKDHQKTGDFSLTLKYPTIKDTGTYVCYFRSLNIWREKTVLLKVKKRTQCKDETVDIRNRSRSTDPTPLMAEQSV